MAKWSDDVKSKYLSTKIGTDITVVVKEINKVEGKVDYEPKDKDGKGQGFLFEFTTEDGSIIGVSTYALQRALVDADVDIGDTVRIVHPSSGEYTVEKIIAEQADAK